MLWDSLAVISKIACIRGQSGAFCQTSDLDTCAYIPDSCIITIIVLFLCRQCEGCEGSDEMTLSSRRLNLPFWGLKSKF